MNFYVFLVTLAATAVCAAQDHTPHHIRICFQWIEMDHPQLTKLMSGDKKSGSDLHVAVLSYVKEGKAKIVDTEILMCRSGQRSKLESFREEIYPTVYNPPGSEHDSLPQFKPDIRSGWYSFETRNNGVSIELEPILNRNNTLVDLVITTEIYPSARLFTWMEHKDQWGDASWRLPFYEKLSVNCSLILANGKFELANVFSPKSTPPVPGVMKKILLFVCADVVPLNR